MNKTPFDHRSALPEQTDGVNRRRLLASGVAVGFALAVQPVMAEAIHTDSDGIMAGAVKIPVTGGDIPGYCAYPSKGGPSPTVLVAHEIFGVHEFIQDVVRRLAKLGFYAIAPDLYARQGDVTKMESVKDIVEKVVSKVSDAQFLGDLDATSSFADKSGKADIGRMGITGFCWGGRVVWLYAAHNPKLRAGVAWYGPLGAPSDPNNHSAISLAGQIKPPVLGLYAGKDAHITAADVAAMMDGLKGGKSDIVTYPDVDHGFFADYRPTYDPAAAADGWKRLQGWFKANGVT